MTKVTAASYTATDDSGHTRIDKLPGVNVGHNPRTRKAESLATSSRAAREALIRELQAIDAEEEPG